MADVRGRALKYAYIQMGFVLVQLVFSLLFSPEEKPDEGAVAKTKRNFNYIVILFPVVPTGLILVGVMKDVVCCLKWGIWLTCLSAAGWVWELISRAATCFIFEEKVEAGCIVNLIIALIATVWLIWGLRVCNQYYTQLTGEGPLCTKVCCCCFSRAGVATGPGNVVMNSPSGQPSDAPPDTAVQIQPTATVDDDDAAKATAI